MDLPSFFALLLKLAVFSLAIALFYSFLTTRQIEGRLAGLAQPFSSHDVAHARGTKTKVAMSLDLLTVDDGSLQTLLKRGDLKSVDLARQCLAQIQQLDGNLHAMITMTPTAILEETTRSIDRERAAGSLRGLLHGIPIIVKVRVLLAGSDGLANILLRITLLFQASGSQPPPEALLCSTPRLEITQSLLTEYDESPLKTAPGLADNEF